MITAKRFRPLLLALIVTVSAGACSSASTARGNAGQSGIFAGQPPLTTAVEVGTWSETAGTDGRIYIADANGRALQFRGFNIKTTKPLTDASDALLNAAEVRGFDLMRLSVYWDQFEPAPGRYDQGYLDKIQTVLDRAAAHGIHVILDFHQDVFGPKFGQPGIPEWATRDDGHPFTPQANWLLAYTEPAVQSAWQHLYEDADLRQAQLDAWTTIAKRFDKSPALFGYDLLNEPFGALLPGENFVQAAIRVQAVQLTAMYQRLSDAIHGVDPGHWIFFEPPNVASLGIPVALGKITGDRLAFFPHFYDASIENDTYTAGAAATGFDPAFFTNYSQAISGYPAKYGYPTLFGEWGIAHPEWAGMGDFVARSLALMDKLGSGWTMFTWCEGGGYCPLDPKGNDRQAIGQIVQPWARAIAGSPTSSTWDPSSRTLVIRYSDSSTSGTTDLVVPAQIYQGMWTVNASDPSGSWHIAITGDVIHVTVKHTGDAHAICLMPASTDVACNA